MDSENNRTGSDAEQEDQNRTKENGNGGSSSESLYEIRLNENVKRSEISDFDLRGLVVRCSSCGRQLNHHSPKELKKHRKLGVITCKECYEFYGSSEFSQDESGYNYCTWCGNGGKLIVCDFCPNGFCSACVRRNFGRSEISITTKEGWMCYCCNVRRLKPKVKFCDLIMQVRENSAVKKEKKASVVNSSNKEISEEWLQKAFNDCDLSISYFTKRLSKLRSIGISKKKSYKHIVKKLEDLVIKHKEKLKNIVNTASKDYEDFLEKQRLKEEEAKHEVVEIIDEASIVNSDCEIIEDVDSNDVQTKETPNKAEENEEQKISESFNKEKEESKMSESFNQEKEEKMEPKRLLLQTSSESDSEKNTEAANDKSPPESVKCNGDIESQSSVETIPRTVSPGKTKVKNASKKLDFSFSSDESVLDSDLDFSQIVKEVDGQIESDKSETEDNQKMFDKLKLESRVLLKRCDHLLGDGETTLVFSDTSDAEDKLDKLVDSLCKFPRNKVSRVPKGKRSSGPPRTKEKQKLLESSSSISLSSEEDEDQKKIKIDKHFPTKPKSPEKKDASESSSSISLGSESEEEVKKKKSKAGSKKKLNSDSSDDFMPSRKKKFDKLLHGPLFSDSDAENKKPREKKEKQTGKKRKLMSSEDEKKSSRSSQTSSSDDSLKPKKGKKRRRIKTAGTDSDEDGSDKPSQDTPSKGRKNIKKIISKDKLDISTKEAQAEEHKRKKRIQERQKLYNKVEDVSMDGKEIITRKMVLEVDQDSKMEVVEIHPDLVCKLKPHQVNGVKFMWENTIESVKELHKPGSGCILAHCMGLGKTLQVIAFYHTLLTNPVVKRTIKRGMVVCPYNTALNWATEFDYWLDEVEGDIKVHQLTSVKNNLERLDILHYWHKEGGVVIISYDIFRRLAAERLPRMKKKDKERVAKYLLDPGPDIVVCDEGHVLKNEKSAISVAMSKLRTKRRIVLTGTPLQNNLKEYHCMLSFVKPSLLGTAKEFRNRFVNPIINGQYDDSSMYDVKLMKKRIHILHKLLDGCVQRCDYSALTKFLPPKLEFVISVKMSEVQIKMYECYLQKITTAKQETKVSGKSLFVDFNNLRCIWTHPFICHVSHERAEIKKMFRDDEEEDDKFINDDSESEESETSGTTSDDDKLLDKIAKDKKKYKTRSKARESPISDKDDDNAEPAKQWYHEFISDADKYNVELSGKMVILQEILKECEGIGDKVLLFSQSLLALDMIEDHLSYTSNQTPDIDADKDVLGTWIKGLDYFRMDGTTSVDFRKSYIDMFNDPTNDRSRLFLISTRAGSLGTNLVGANRVVIFDTSWNPSHDVQAIFRVYRFGQLKPVYIYRLLAQGTMEEKIYDRQVTKLSLSCRVVDEQQIDRHFSAADLAELYTFDRNPTKQRPTPMLPKDRLLAELLIKVKDWIVTYHEHDSLLQNQTEEDLTEEERQAAWTEYENEREGNQPETGPEFNDALFMQEPDFSEDYEGRKIPDIKTIVDSLFERIKRENPSVMSNQVEIKKKLVQSVAQVRQAFQEKHVRILRLKQEYVQRGTVPNALNKYMDELSAVLKSTGEYITRLSSVIAQEQLAQQQEYMKKAGMQQNVYRQPMRPQANVQRGRPMPRMHSNFNFRLPNNFNHLNAQQRAAAFAAMLHTMNTGASRVNMGTHTYSRNARGTSQNPVIVTEVDDVTPPSASAASSNGPANPSTVTIEEIND